MNNFIKIAKSKISGQGVFANININKFQTICFLEGEKIDIYEMMKRIDDGIEAGSDPLQIDDETYLDLDELSRLFNHSCNPNGYIKGRNELIAIKDIKIGEEIKYDYSTTMNDNEKIINDAKGILWTCRCKCGESNCRKLIDQFRRLPKETQEFYINNKMIPDFILRKFDKN